MGVESPSVRCVIPQEPDSLDDLIADCAEIPNTLRATHPALPQPRAAARWEVDDACLAQVIDLEEFV